MTIGEKIRSLRTKKDWSQGDLGEKIGVPGQNISRYETDRVRPRLKTLEALAAAFEVPVEIFTDLSPATEVSGIDDVELVEYFQMVSTLEPEDQDAIKRVLKAMINNKRAQSLLAS